jgi:hypothetical protein
LRHEDWNVRLKAAKYIVESEYTYAIPDLKAAVLVEKNSYNKKKLEKLLKILKGFINK